MALVSRVGAVHKYEGKEYRLRRGDSLDKLPRALVEVLKRSGMTMGEEEVSNDENSYTETVSEDIE
ncbi:hypothetical protein [Bacillus phage BSTP8]|nr:hypothetical protein BSP19_054 [Bacillus phage BSP19]AYJ76140.1 hypothetical protein BSP7_024 [Bacillus phage BSP7]QQO90069.1 hypothetical protein BSTP5_008 [Bacillus phage BSTP5]QRI44358.1 hypothetical protein [Bacillus phage BSTP8]QRI44409.1 hypothetical protein [Bacillus phage BSTP10]QRI44539.1 hypothetical protein [Bacillus phage BSTP12]